MRASLRRRNKPFQTCVASGSMTDRDRKGEPDDSSASAIESPHDNVASSLTPGEAVEERLPTSSLASVLGARTAFRLDPASRGQLEKLVASTTASIAFPTEALEGLRRAAMEAVSPATQALEGIVAAAATQAMQPSTQAIEGIIAAVAAAARPSFSTEAFRSLTSAAAGVSQTAFTEGYLDTFRTTARFLSESVSVPSLYSTDQMALRRDAQKTSPRETRSAEAFFDEHAVEITDVSSLLKVISATQRKHHDHRLVWRGQQNVEWSVHSSLYRKLDKIETPSEDGLIAAEVTGMELARKWGERRMYAMEYFADLQHYGAPTRLLDATLDPEMAAWFATEANPQLDDTDGRMIAWGRAGRVSARKMSESSDDLPEREDAPFWHSWTNDDDRGRVGWGTGSKTWSWFPPALSDRMRAQRAGFLLEAGPLVTPTVADVLSGNVSLDWRVTEITRATSIIGVPSRHDVRTTPNEAHLVPLFSFRISAQAKPAIRNYLATKGLTFSSVYPDRGGLVEYLKGPFGLGAS
jgi:hypothetical protein